MDFIDKVATVSGTSGKPYVIRFKDSREVKCGDYLTAELKKMEKDKAEKPQDAASPCSERRHRAEVQSPRLVTAVALRSVQYGQSNQTL